MIEIPEKIPAGMKYYNYIYEYKGQSCGGGFVGSDPGAVFDTQPLRDRPEAREVRVKEVTREEFIKSLEDRQKDPDTQNFNFFDPGFYGFKRTPDGWRSPDEYQERKK